MAAWQNRTKLWLSNVFQRTRKTPSLELLKSLHIELLRNQALRADNQKGLVEVFRSISEILIWGDQNDSKIFDYFCEHNMLSFFLTALAQNSDPLLTVQLLQSLSIVFENMTNENAMYYLLSNNHINSIIAHKFDFSNEEVIAYYVSLLKTLSLRLNQHTVHFFYNEHLRDFPLLTESLKFFTHHESMVRIAVRTITLNIFRVSDKRVTDFVCQKTGEPFMTHLMWYIGSVVLNVQEALEEDREEWSKLATHLDDHLDHWNYINDVISLNHEPLTSIVIKTSKNKLIEPLYLASYFQNWDTLDESSAGPVPKISSLQALYFLTHLFVTVEHGELLCYIVNRVLCKEEQDGGFQLKGLAHLASALSEVAKQQMCQAVLSFFIVILRNIACSEYLTSLISALDEEGLTYKSILQSAVIGCLNTVCIQNTEVSSQAGLMCIELLQLLDCPPEHLMDAEMCLSAQLRHWLKVMAADEFVGIYRKHFRIAKSKQINSVLYVQQPFILLNRQEEQEDCVKVLNLFFHLHKLLGTADKDLIPPPGLQLNENDIIESSGFDMFLCLVAASGREREQFVAVSPDQCLLVEPDRLPGQGKIKKVITLDELEYMPDPASHNTMFISQRGRRLSYQLRFKDGVTFKAAIKCIGKRKAQTLHSQVEFVANLLKTTPPECNYDEIDDLSFEILQHNELGGVYKDSAPTKSSSPNESLEMKLIKSRINSSPENSVSFKKGGETIHINTTTDKPIKNEELAVNEKGAFTV